MYHNSFATNLTKNFSFSGPLIRFSLNTVRSLVVQAFIKTLKDATMPKAEISFHSLTHLFHVLSFVFFFKLSLKKLKNICRDNKQSLLLIIKRLFLILKIIRKVRILGLRAKVCKYLKWTRSNIFIYRIDYFLHIPFLSLINKKILQMKDINFLRYSRIELKLVAIPWTFWTGGFFYGGGPEAFLRMTEISRSIKRYLLRTLKSSILLCFRPSNLFEYCSI